MTRCSGIAKAKCEAPCEWIVAKGCKNTAKSATASKPKSSKGTEKASNGKTSRKVLKEKTKPEKKGSEKSPNRKVKTVLKQKQSPLPRQYNKKFIAFLMSKIQDQIGFPKYFPFKTEDDMRQLIEYMIWRRTGSISRGTIPKHIVDTEDRIYQAENKDPDTDMISFLERFIFKASFDFLYTEGIIYKNP